MENQGYEEELSTRSLLSRQYSVQDFTAAVDNSRSSPVVRENHAIGLILPLHADQEAHVYEDIVVSSLEDSISIDQPHCFPTNAANNNNLYEGTLRRSQNGSRNHRNARTVTSITGFKDPSNFDRNLTLPTRRSSTDVGVEESTTRFSVRVTNRERSRCLANKTDSYLYESSVGSTRVSDELTETTNFVIGKPGRRRRKKDCKHCKSKANGGSMREQLSDHTTEDLTSHDAPFPVDLADRTRASANKDVIERGEKMVHGLEPTFSIPDGILPNFETQCGGHGTQLQDGQSKPIFSISNNANDFSSANGPKPLNYDKNDTDVRPVPVEHMDDRALITPEKNRAGMKVNSIYSQDHWHSKEVTIFITDVKEQNPFQVRA